MARRSAHIFLIHSRREVEVSSDTGRHSCFAGNLGALARHGLFFLFEPWMLFYCTYLPHRSCCECIVVDLSDGGDIYSLK